MRFDRSGSLVSFLPAAAVVDRDVSAGARQSYGDRPPDACAGARNDSPAGLSDRCPLLRCSLVGGCNDSLHRRKVPALER